ncbi:MAG TPA: choice-of-anchor A family protein [Solirubrobacteraceae bacterium]|nr:choice-of-anchor A family protein [Solirubrobacteraceae bacterium]
MRWAWWAAATVVAAVAVPVASSGSESGSEPVRARSAQTSCADVAPVTDFNTFVLGDHRITNNDVYGRVAIGGDALLNTLAPQGSISLGNGLSSKNVNRNDLIVRGDIVSPGNAQVNSGSVIYAGALQGSIGAYGSVTRVDPADLPFDFDDVFVRLSALQDSWADLADQKSPEIIGSGDDTRVRFVGTSRTLNVFSVTAATLQRAKTIQIGVPGGTATTLINVSGSAYTSTDRPTTETTFNVDDPVGTGFEKVGAGDTTSPAGRARARVVWNFHEATTVQIGSDSTQGPTVHWEGSVIAPKATVLLGRSTDFFGTLVAGRLEQTGTARLPGLGNGACLPPPCEPVGPPTEPEPEPEPQPPPLPSTPIQPSPPGASRPPSTGSVAGEQAGSTRIVLCKRRNRARVHAGGTVTFRLEVRNVGLARAERVVVCDRTPAGLRIIRARGAQIRNGRACWRFASVRDERTMHLTARVNATARGVIRNVARARAANAGTARGRARVRVLAAPIQLCSAFCG